jgi:predicted DNA-binding transcriptional regulator YafY
MSRHLARLLQIDSLLRSGNRQTQQSLAQATERSDRTIRSDLDFLRDTLGAPLEYQKDKGWHYTDPDWRLPSISLSQGELFALTLGARMLETYSGSTYVNELRTAIARLSERLPEKTWIDLQQIADERILFRGGAEILNFNPQIWEDLVTATRQSQKVWMSYFAATNNSKTERVIDPYFLDIYRGTNPYLIAFCNLRQSFRDFRIDRIEELKVLDTKFERDPSFNPREYLEKRFQYESGNEIFAIEIWFDATTAPFIRERRWHSSQELLEHSDGSLTLRISVSGLNDLKRWVLGYGKGAVVKSPSELVELVKEEIKAMNSNYLIDGGNF